MHDLAYSRPSTLVEALHLLSEDGARPLAGGTDLIPQLREGRRTAHRVVDLKAIPDLLHMGRQDDGTWRVGAAISIGRLAAHVDFAREHHALLASARLIGSLQIQNRATLGGNICNGAPSADAVPLLIALGAAANIAHRDGLRRANLATLFAGPGRTSLLPNEIVVAVELPARSPRSAASYLRFTPRREMDIAIAGAGVRLELGGSGEIIDAAVVLASVAPTPFEVPGLAQTLLGRRPTATLFAEAGEMAATACRPISDTRASAAYRRTLVAVLTRRALTDCCRQLGVGLS